MLLLDRAAERRSDERDGEFISAVEAVRVGSLAAFDDKVAARWASQRMQRVSGQPAGKGVGLEGEALERAIMHIALGAGDIVKVVQDN